MALHFGYDIYSFMELKSHYLLVKHAMVTHFIYLK